MSIFLFGIKGLWVVAPLCFWAITLFFLGKVVWYIFTGRENDDDPLSFGVFQGIFLTVIIVIIEGSPEPGPHDLVQKLSDALSPIVFLLLFFFSSLFFIGLNFLLMKIGTKIRRYFAL